jgi:hypothetical protein
MIGNLLRHQVISGGVPQKTNARDQAVFLPPALGERQRASGRGMGLSSGRCGQHATANTSSSLAADAAMSVPGPYLL